MTYQRLSDETPPAYWDCPKWCPEQKERRESPCEACPTADQDREMKRELEQNLTERLGDAWRPWGVDGLLRTVYEIGYLAETDDSEWTVTTARLVNIYRSEQSRQRRVDDYNRRQAQRQRSARHG